MVTCNKDGKSKSNKDILAPVLKTFFFYHILVGSLTLMAIRVRLATSI